MSRFHQGLNRRWWARARAEAMTRAGWRCARCGRHGRLDCHHRTPLSEGGAPYDQRNIEVLCRACHYTESGQIPIKGRDAWMRRLRLQHG